MENLSIQDLSNQIWASAITNNLVPIGSGLYEQGFRLLGDDPPTINHFDTLFHNYDRKMNYALNQIFEVIKSTNGVNIDENRSSTLYTAIKKMIPSKGNYVRQNVDEIILGKKTFIDSLNIQTNIDPNSITYGNIELQKDDTFKFYIKNPSNNIKEYTLGHSDDNFMYEIPTSSNNIKEIVTGGKLAKWWEKNNPQLTNVTNVGSSSPVPIIRLDSNGAISDLPTGYVGVANVSKHPELKNFNFSNNLIYIEKIANTNGNNAYVRIRGVGTSDSDMSHEGVCTGNRNSYRWKRESTNFELIKMMYPVGICVFFVYNVNPNVAWAGSGMKWQYICENKVVRLGKMDGSDLTEQGGNDFIHLSESQMPWHTHDFGATTSWDNEKTFGTSFSGNHIHSINNVSIGRTEMSWYKWGWADNRPCRADNSNSGWSGDHNHTVTVSGHNHYVSGTTTARGGGDGIWITNPYIKLMGWFRIE